MKYNVLSIMAVLAAFVAGLFSVSARDISHMDPENILVITIENPLPDGTKTVGHVAILMRPDVAPNHVKRVKELARKKFYDGIIFHRVEAGFMAQTGDPTGTGTGGSGQKLLPEFNKLPHLRGTVSMARADAEDSADSQFFICFTRTAFLDGKYTAWGRVVTGMDVVDGIPLGTPPRVPGKMTSVRVAADIEGWADKAKNF